MASVMKTSGKRPGKETMHEQQQQLLMLFEKRNELKREFARVLDEYDALKEEHANLKQQAEHDRERLEGLEEVLSDPARCQNVIIYYRLRGLSEHCHRLLSRRRDELREKFEALEKQKQLEEFRAHAAEEQTQLERKAEQLRGIHEDLAGNVESLRDALARSQKPWHYFKRKRLATQLAEAEEQLAPVAEQFDTTKQELQRVTDRRPPEYKGLSPKSKREINLQLIALAQYLYVHFMENDFASLARKTYEKQPHECDYGTVQDCLAMQKPIADAIARLKEDDKRAEKLQRRLAHLRENVAYEGNGDTVPVLRSIAKVQLNFVSSSSADHMQFAAQEADVSIVESRYWRVDELLLE